MFGDPHIYTFDGMPYTFNGKGEFVLVRANSPRVKLDVQGRFEQVEDSPYGEVFASHLTAVAAKDNVSSTVEVCFNNPNVSKLLVDLLDFRGLATCWHVQCRNFDPKFQKSSFLTGVNDKSLNCSDIILGLRTDACEHRDPTPDILVVFVSGVLSSTPLPIQCLSLTFNLIFDVLNSNFNSLGSPPTFVRTMEIQTGRVSGQTTHLL